MKLPPYRNFECTLRFRAFACLTTRIKTRHPKTKVQRQIRHQALAVCATSFTLSLCSGQQQIFQKKKKCIGKSDAEHGLTYSSKSIAPRAKKSQADWLLSASRHFLTYLSLLNLLREFSIRLFQLAIAIQIQPCQRNALRRTYLSFFAKRNNNFDQTILNSSVQYPHRTKIPTLYVLL